MPSKSRCGKVSGAMMRQSWPRRRRDRATWATEFATPFVRGRNDSAEIAIRTDVVQRICVIRQRYPHDVSWKGRRTDGYVASAL